jgi:hypothetical protein
MDLISLDVLKDALRQCRSLRSAVPALATASLQFQCIEGKVNRLKFID